MIDEDSRLRELITRGREGRNLEYKGAGGQESFAWGPDRVNARLTRTIMGLANSGGGAIVIGMDQAGPDQWQPNGVDQQVDASYEQDRVQRYVNGRADPFVELTVFHFRHDGKRFVIIEVLGFRELPVVCTRGSGALVQGAIYTRSRDMYETVVVQSQSEMREMLDRAIAVGVEMRLRPVFEAIRAAGLDIQSGLPDEEGFRLQRGDL